MNRLIKKITGQREFALVIVLLVISITMTFASPVFLTSMNIKSLLLALSVETIIAVAMTNLMVSGGFDMSVGSVVGLTGVTMGLLLKGGVPLILAILIACLLGVVIGFIQGMIISKLGINAFVTTLAGLSIYRGLTYIITNGEAQGNFPKAFLAIGQSEILGIPSPIWIAIIVVIIGDILLRKSRFFRQNYYIGGNRKAAEVSGIKVDRMTVVNYMISGLFAAIAGLVLASRMGSASLTAGQGMELRVITATIIGGASLNGGEGTVLGTFLGSMLMVIIMNVLTLLSINIYWQTFVVGATLLLAVMIDTFNTKLNQKRLSE